MASPDGIQKPTLDQLLHAFAKYEAENPPALTAQDHKRISDILARIDTITPKTPLLTLPTDTRPVAHAEHSLAAKSGGNTSCFKSEADGLHICLQRESERDGEGKSTSEKWVLYFETQESRWAGRILSFDLLDELNTPLFSGYAMLPKTKLANDGYYCVSIALSDNDLNTITHGEAVRGIAVAPAEWSAHMQKELRDIATDETCPNTLRTHANSILAESEVR